MACVLKLNANQCQQIAARVQTLIPPESIAKLFNCTPLEAQMPHQQFPATLPTEVAASDGWLRRINREAN